MHLIVGLGNPGEEYAQTRHNVGFMLINKLVKHYLLDDAKKKFSSRCHEGRIANQKVLAIKPQTYMNLSGQAVSQAANFYKIQPSEVMAIVDDIALPVGQIRIKPKGSAGGHNGLKDIQNKLGTDAYPRLRIGIGKPEINGHPIPQKDYVLGRWTAEQADAIEKALPKACEAIACWLEEGLNEAMNRFNRKNEETA